MNELSPTSPGITFEYSEKSKKLQYRGSGDKDLKGLDIKILGSGPLPEQRGVFDRLRGTVWLNTGKKDDENKDIYVKVSSSSIKKLFNLRSGELKSHNVTDVVKERLDFSKVIHGVERQILVASKHIDPYRQKADYDHTFKTLEYAFKIAENDEQKKEIFKLLGDLSEKYRDLPDKFRDKLKMSMKCCDLILERGGSVKDNLETFRLHVSHRESSSKVQAALGHYYCFEDPQQLLVNVGMQWLNVAAERGEISAMRDLADHYLSIKYSRTAYQWGDKAIAAGDDYSRYYLALNLKGKAGKDTEASTKEFEKAAKAGNLKANLELGKIYSNDQKYYIEAKKHLEQAEKSKDDTIKIEAQTLLKNLASNINKVI